MKQTAVAMVLAICAALAAGAREWRDIGAEISRAAETGGGKVVVPAGEWECGPIHLKSNVELHFEDGADVLFTDDLEKYLPAVPTSWEGVECLNWSPLVYANEATNVAVTGRGVLHPRMGRWEAWLWRGPDQQAAKRRLFEEWGEKDVPLGKRDLTAIPESRFRPQFVCVRNCRGVRLEDFTLRHSPFWCVHLLGCEGVEVRRVTVDAHMGNNDAIDIESTKDVLVEDCRLSPGDDIICIKSGRDRDGRRRARPTENVVVRRVTADSGHAFLGIGSELSGGVRNILMEDCEMEGTCNYVFRLKTTPTRGGFVENVTMRRIKAKHVSVNAVDFTTAYYTDAASVVKTEVPPTRIGGIRLEDIFVESAERRVELRSLPDWPIEGFVIDGLKVHRTSKCDVVENVPVAQLPVAGAERPADFDAFWAEAKAKYDREVPVDVKMERVESLSCADENVYRVSVTSPHGRTVDGMLAEPADLSKGPFPARLNVPGAGPSWGCVPTGRKGFVRLVMNVHFYPLVVGQHKHSSPNAELLALERAETAECMEKFGVNRYCKAGISKSREDFHYYDCILAIDRVVDWLAKRPEVDPRNIRYAGTSQGGGMGLILTGLNRNITKAAIYVPALTDLMAYRQGRPAGWPDLIGGQPKEGRAAAERFAPYFDAAHFAARIEVPIRVVAGLADKTCDWRAVHAGYHAIPSKDKSLWSVPGMPHKVDERVYREIGAWLDAD